MYILLCAGVFIFRNQFTVGKSANASCKTDAQALRIEWLRDGVVVESDNTAGIQELDLEFSLVSDTIHNQVYVCRVTREGKDGMQPVTAVQNFTVNVNGKVMLLKNKSMIYNFFMCFLLVPPTVISTAVTNSSSTTRAGSFYNLTCIVS